MEGSWSENKGGRWKREWVAAESARVIMEMIEI